MSTTKSIIDCTGVPALFSMFAIVTCYGLSSGYASISSHFGWLNAFPALQSTDSYASFMGTVAQSSATMLALFFTAVSVVASTAYAKAHNDIRSLVVYDVPNSRYLKLIAHTAATSVGALLLSSIGVVDSVPLAIYVVIITGICLLAFFPLAIRTFSLFDPDNLIVYPRMAFRRALASASAPNRRYKRHSFQRHANAIAEHQLRVLLEILIFKTQDQPFPHASILGMGLKICELLRQYGLQKHAIPTDSLWFSRKIAFKKWSATDSIMTEVALSTGTIPAQEQVPDHQFVEKRCIHMLKLATSALLQHGKIDEASNLFQAISSTVTLLEHAKLFDEASLVAESAREVFTQHVLVPKKWSRMEALQITDLVGVLSIDLVLHAGRAISSNPDQECARLVAAVRQGDATAIYRHPVSRSMSAELEDLVRRMEYEREVDGTSRMSTWFVKQIVAQSYANEIKNTAERILVSLRTGFLPVAHQVISHGLHEVGSMWLLRAHEACHKASFQLIALRDSYIALSESLSASQKFPDSGIDSLIKSVSETQSYVLRQLADLVAHLVKLEAEDASPDLLGSIRAHIATELVKMMGEKTETGFTNLFDAYLGATWHIRDSFAALAKTSADRRALNLTIDTTLDMLELSGLAFIYSELDGTSFARTVGSSWDAKIAEFQYPGRVLEMLLATLDVEGGMPMMSAGYVQRFEWMKSLRADLERRGFPHGDFFDYYDNAHRTPHPNPVIESLFRSLFLGSDARAYFCVLYLMKRSDFKSSDIPRKIQECKDAIARAARSQMSEGEAFDSMGDDDA